MPADSINGCDSDIPIRPATVHSDAPAAPAVTPDSLDTTAAMRPEKIARAHELLADVNYPTDQDLNRLAGILAAAP